jgi:hypothetical protein
MVPVDHLNISRLWHSKSPNQAADFWRQVREEGESTEILMQLLKVGGFAHLDNGFQRVTETGEGKVIACWLHGWW